VSERADGRLIIIGAGPAGLALAASHGGPSLIIEQAGEVGGLCRSIEFGGALFDIGGHSFHTPHAEVAALVGGLMAENWEEQQRDARIALDGQLIDYPFQDHVDQIADARIVAECRAGPSGTADRAPDNFGAWIEARFGAGIARHFMRPYNEKLWARDLRRMSCEWVGERIAGAQPPTAAGRAPLAADSRVGYPAQGGFVEIFRAMAQRAGPIQFRERVVAIDLAERRVRTATGRRFAWDHLVSTMPLPALLACIADCPSELVNAASRLENVSLKVVMIAADRAPGERPQRLYLPAPGIAAHKIAFNHRSSAALRRRPREAVMCEVSWSPFKPAPADAELERTMIDWLATNRLIAGDRAAIEARTIDVPLAYPVPTAERAAIVATARAWLAGHGIFTIGRFGGWSYANSDACIHEALELADSLQPVLPQ